MRCQLLLLLLAALLLAACPPTVTDEGLPFPDLDSSKLTDDNGLSTKLVCPGSVGCARADGPLRAGVAARVITPVVEAFEDLDGSGVRNGDEPFTDENGNGRWDAVWIAGFSLGRAATGVHDDNWTRALVLEKGDLKVGFVELDLIGFFHPDVLRVRRAAKEAGLEYDALIVGTTHQHEGKDTMGIWGQDVGTSGYEEAYMQRIADETVAALAEAEAALTQVSLRVGQGEAPHLVNDTRDPYVVDQRILTLDFEAGSDVTATLLIWGNHPESLGSRNTLVTSDYPHYLREALEAARPSSTAVFAPGALGGLMAPIGIVGCPDAEGNETCPQGTFERAMYIGEGIAEVALASVAADDALVVDEPALAYARLPALPPLENAKFGIAFQLGLLKRSAYTSDGTELPWEALVDLPLGELTMGDLKVSTEVSRLTLGPVELALVPGEIYPELWLEKEGGGSFIERPENADFPGAEAETPIQAVMPRDSIRVVVSNANDALGYIIPKPQWDLSSPFAYDPDGQYGEENSLGPHCGATLTAAFAELYELVSGE